MKTILLHGLGQTAASWNRTVEAMETKADILCPDLPDWLCSREVCYAGLYQAFVEYCMQIQEPLNICGLSLGGILALQYGIENPGKVNSIVLIGTQYVMPKGLLRLQNRIFHLMPDRTFQSMGFGKKEFISLTKSMIDLDFEQELNGIRCPVLVICGKRDQANKAAALQMKERIPDAQIAVIENAGHEVNVDAPEKLGEVLKDFFQLRHEGTAGKGSLSQEAISRKLSEAGIELAVEVRQSVDSTSTALLQYAQQGEQRDRVLLAESQGSGRGRRGRSFYSPEGTGLYMSLLLHLKVSLEEGTMLTALAAAAVVQALEAVSGKEVWIKWVNDILIDGKKAAGILTEGSPVCEDGKLSYAIVGIGINLYEPEGGFPAEIADRAGAVFACQQEKTGLRDWIAAEVLIRFMSYYRDFPGKSYLEEYRRHSVVLGKKICILTPEEADETVKKALSGKTYATAVDIDERCRLKVQYEDGTCEYLSNGEVSIRF